MFLLQVGSIAGERRKDGKSWGPGRVYITPGEEKFRASRDSFPGTGGDGRRSCIH